MGVVGDWLTDIDFYTFISDLKYGGWFEYVFPFMLVYAIVFTILNYVEIFADKKPVKVIIAIVFGLFSIAFPITDDGVVLGEMMAELFPDVTAFTIGILALYIVVAMLGVDLAEFFGKDDDTNKILRYVLGGLGLIVVGVSYGKALGYWDTWNGSWLEDFLTDPMLYIIVIFGLFFFWMNTDEDSETKSEFVKNYKNQNPDASTKDAQKAYRDRLRS